MTLRDKTRKRTITLTQPLTISKLICLQMEMENELGKRVTMEEAVSKMIDDEMERRIIKSGLLTDNERNSARN